MFCPDTNQVIPCPDLACPFYLHKLDSCLKALLIKKELDILSKEEKEALADFRKDTMRIGRSFLKGL